MCKWISYLTCKLRRACTWSNIVSICWLLKARKVRYCFLVLLRQSLKLNPWRTWHVRKQSLYVIEDMWFKEWNWPNCTQKCIDLVLITPPNCTHCGPPQQYWHFRGSSYQLLCSFPGWLPGKPPYSEGACWSWWALRCHADLRDSPRRAAIQTRLYFWWYRACAVWGVTPYNGIQCPFVIETLFCLMLLNAISH